MDSNCYLNPTLIKAQCEWAIRRLQKDNEAYHVAEKSLDSFITDEEIQSSAFDALKQQIVDYKTVLQALRSANDSDMADFATLSGAVGDEVLDGSVIVEGKETAYEAKIANESKAQEYEEMANAESFFLWEWYYRSLANNHWKMAENYERIHLEWWSKEAAYDTIFFLTKDLFSASRDTRAAACSGLQSIAEAYVDGVYRPDINASWRTDIVDCYIERVIAVTEEGEVIVDMREVEKILSKDAEDITSQEYDAIALAYLNADVEELGLFLQCMMGEREDVKYSLIDIVKGTSAGYCCEDYSEWKLDGQKFAKFQERIESAAEETLLMVQMFRAVSDNESARVMIKQRDVILQRLTLLGVVEEIGTFRGGYKGEYPYVSVGGGEEGTLILKFHEL